MGNQRALIPREAMAPMANGPLKCPRGMVGFLHQSGKMLMVSTALWIGLLTVVSMAGLILKDRLRHNDYFKNVDVVKLDNYIKSHGVFPTIQLKLNWNMLEKLWLSK